LIGFPLAFERSIQASLSEAMRLASKSIEIHGELEGAVKDVLRIALAQKGLVYVEDEHLPFVRTCVVMLFSLVFDGKSTADVVLAFEEIFSAFIG
jgi:hypothetical protein